MMNTIGKILWPMSRVNTVSCVLRGPVQCELVSGLQI